jgi:hypothetical protein
MTAAEKLGAQSGFARSGIFWRFVAPASFFARGKRYRTWFARKRSNITECWKSDRCRHDSLLFNSVELLIAQINVMA